MRLIWKIAAIVAGVAAICGGSILWLSQKRANERKLAEAARVCRINAEQGDAKAQYSLGRIYSHGEGVPQDYAEALRWYLKAADQGNVRAESAIGSLYYYSRGVTQDFTEALRWYHEAADQNDAYAQNAIGIAYDVGNGVEKNAAEAARWYHKAADQGNASAQYNLGYMYYYGQGVPRDRAEADRWYRKAADQGDEYAQRALGLRLSAMRNWNKVTHAVIFLASLLLLMNLLKPGVKINNWQQWVPALSALLLLIYLALDIYSRSEYCLFPSVIVANAFSFFVHLLTGITVPMLFYIVLPKSPKIFLVISGILFAGLNLLIVGLFLYLIVHYKMPPSSIPIHILCDGEGMFTGMFVTSAILLRLKEKQACEGESDDSELLVTEDRIESDSE